jgi:hypothetical protein
LLDHVGSPGGCERREKTMPAAIASPPATCNIVSSSESSTKAMIAARNGYKLANSAAREGPT